MQIQAGVYARGDVASGGYGVVEVTFSEPFDAVPVVVAAVQTGAGFRTANRPQVTVSSVTADGFTALVTNPGNGTYNCSVNWTATLQPEAKR